MTPVFVGSAVNGFLIFLNQSSQRGKELRGGVVVAAAFSGRLTKICRTPNDIV